MLPPTGREAGVTLLLPALSLGIFRVKARGQYGLPVQHPLNMVYFSKVFRWELQHCVHLFFKTGKCITRLGVHHFRIIIFACGTVAARLHGNHFIRHISFQECLSFLRGLGVSFIFLICERYLLKGDPLHPAWASYQLCVFNGYPTRIHKSRDICHAIAHRPPHFRIRNALSVKSMCPQCRKA